jgi:hypothetical protein
VIALPVSAGAVQVLVELGIQNPLRQRLLQLVNQTVLVEYVLRIASSKKLVQKVLLDSHVMLLRFRSSWPPTLDS